jgi:hypothetical protein
MDKEKEKKVCRCQLYAGLPFCRFCIRGVGGFLLATPLAWGAPKLTGVGAPLSSSALTVDDGLLRLLLAGLVLALGPLELVPC